MAFNLIDQPWILVQPAEGAQQEVSLRQIFSEGSSIRRITGEVPTQGFALLRLLLAICHDAVGWHTTDAIEQLHEDGLDLAAIDAYLDEWHARFDLLDPQRPFFQVAGLATANGEHSGLEKIIADVPNGQPFFTTRAGRGLAQISLAEAARWLIHVQAFDPSGIRSGAVGDALAKNGKGYPIGPAWSGHLGGIVQHGDSLLQTLLLNITETPKNPADRPVWTWPNAPTAVRAEEAIPAGPVQLLVWQSRRVRLVSDPDASAIIGVVLSQGDKLTRRTGTNSSRCRVGAIRRHRPRSSGRPHTCPTSMMRAGRSGEAFQPCSPRVPGWSRILSANTTVSGLPRRSKRSLTSKDASHCRPWASPTGHRKRLSRRS